MTSSTPDFRGTHLFDRLLWAQENLTPQQPRYCIVWEDPATFDEPCKITVAAPEWMACALNGGILPPIDAYIADARAEAEWTALYPGQPFSYDKVGGAKHPYAAPIASMTEEEAMEYLVQQVLPERVWGQPHNRPYFLIVHRSQIPTDRRNRNQWKMADFV